MSLLLFLLLLTDWREDTPAEAQNLTKPIRATTLPTYEITHRPGFDSNHWFSLTVDKPGLYEVRSYGTLDLTVRVFRGGTLIAESDDHKCKDGSVDLNFYLLVRLEPGQYVLRVRPYHPDHVGSYQLLIVRH